MSVALTEARDAYSDDSYDRSVAATAPRRGREPRTPHPMAETLTDALLAVVARRSAADALPSSPTDRQLHGGAADRHPKGLDAHQDRALWRAT